jgi:3-deoxy-alpha-D-manno-octulosonate 8-oxidase
MHKNFKGIEKTVFGRGSFSQLGTIVEERRGDNDGFMLYLVDNYFKGKDLSKRVPAKPADIVQFVDVDPEEPTTKQVDAIRDQVKASKGTPSAVIGIGGGSVLDLAKALSLMFTNEGSSVQYQGLNLIKKPGVYHIGIPTISGTGAEVSMTAVLTGPEKKLGLKCEWTVFNQVLLDPELISSVPRDKWFYTGMDTYIHCIESRDGILNNAYSTAFGEQSLALCREIYLGDNAGQNPENDEKLMVASLMGGLSLTYSEVGIVHALSYGLSKILGTKHCFANCVVFQHLGDYYPEGVAEFNEMIRKHQITLPKNLTKTLDDATITAMANVSIRLEHMWNHAIGTDWKSKVTLDTVKDLFKRL